MGTGREDSSAAISQVESAIAPFRTSFRADGYDINVKGIEDGVISFAIVALEGACEGCLVPRDLMGKMIAAVLPAPLQAARIELDYPGQ
jgi:Fe-S cluster biogenesis protein NfuA